MIILTFLSMGETNKSQEQAHDKDLKLELEFNNSALQWDLVNTEKKRVVALLKNGKSTTMVVLLRSGFKTPSQAQSFRLQRN